MKKFLSLLLCLVFAVTMLASCSEDVIGDYEYPNFVPKETPAITLDFYIVVGEGTSDLAKDTVERMLSQYTETKYKTSLVLHYIEETDYRAELLEGINKTGNDKADIVLVNSAELMKELVAGNKLLDLTAYYDGDTYGRLNTMITKTLIEASKINGKIYSVPNDHVIGEYTYLIIDEDVATIGYNFSPASLEACKSLDDDTMLRLKSAIEADGKKFSDYVQVVSGDYSDKAAYEADGYICNISSYPQVTEDEAFASSFAIVNGIQYSDRAMEILYLLNNDAYFRNLLHYGVEGANYVKDSNGNIVPLLDEDGRYNMNMLYTGSAFLLYYNEFWTKEMNDVGLAQNKESVVAKPAK